MDQIKQPCTRLAPLFDRQSVVDIVEQLDVFDPQISDCIAMVGDGSLVMGVGRCRDAVNSVSRGIVCSDIDKPLAIYTALVNMIIDPSIAPLVRGSHCAAVSASTALVA